jgi:uncharacterized protein
VQAPREPKSTRRMTPGSAVEGDCAEASATAAAASRVHVYDLRQGERTSDGFYAVVSRFADEAVARVEQRAGTVLDGYERHVHFLAESPRSRGEYAVELLTLGMALRRYEGAAERTATWVVGLARTLTWARTRSERAKPLMDWMRAGITRLVFAPRAGCSARKTGSAVERLARLAGWLEATGEFGQESKRLHNWRSYLDQVSPEKAMHWLHVADGLFTQFERDAAKALGSYTRNVAAFVEREQRQRRWREDLLLRSRTAAEYHLNMVAAEVMNRGLREEFGRTRQKVVLVPTCMRGRRSLECRARMDGVDMTCTGCDPDCAVNRITRRMRAEGVAVYMVPHASGFSRWLRRWEKTDCGVAAVACMLNILPGGYEMRERHIASQCVPLDFPGCRRHWDEKGFPTTVNEERLVQIVTGAHR